MPQMLRLSQGHWLNLDDILAVHDDGPTIVVSCKHSAAAFRYRAEERERLLAWLAHHSTYVAVSRPDDDNPFEESTDAPAD